MPPKKRKKVTGFVKLQLPAGKATPAPPVGSALGAKGVNIMQFCQAFNAATQDKGDTIIPVEITVYEDKTFDFITKTPPAAFLIKEAIGTKTGSKEPHTKKIGQLSKAQLRSIAELKMPDLNANDIDAAMKIVRGTARSMGVQVEGIRETGVYTKGKKRGRPGAPVVEETVEFTAPVEEPVEELSVETEVVTEVAGESTAE